MRLGVKLASIILGILFLFIGLFLVIREGYLNNFLKNQLERYLSKQGVIVHIGQLELGKSYFLIKEITFNYHNFVTSKIELVRGDFNLKDIWRNRNIDGYIKAENIIINSHNQPFIKEANAIIHYKHHLMSDATHVDFVASNLINGEKVNISPGSAKCTYKGETYRKEFSDCQLNLGENIQISFRSNVDYSMLGIDAVRMQGQLSAIPIPLYKLVKPIFSENSVIEFLDEYIKNGEIISGNFDLHLDKEFFKTKTVGPENLKGKFFVRNLDYQYDKDLPPLSNIETSILLEGSKVDFQLHKAYSGKTLISNGMISLDWGEGENTKVIAKAEAEGSAADLTSFIPEKSLEETRKSGIDLKQFTGIAKSNIELIIPIKVGTENLYNITTTINAAGLKIFDDTIELSKAKITGVFDGKQVRFSGQGSINNLPSELNYIFNFLPEVEFDHQLKLKINLQKSLGKLSLFKILSGQGILNFEYKSKDGNSSINTEANLRNLDFYLDKIAIHKKAGEKANFTLSGNIDNGNDGSLEFKLLGDNNLKIIGKSEIIGDKKKLTFSAIKHKDTSLKGEVIVDNKGFVAKLDGGLLDLSGANMMQFMEKEHNAKNTELKVSVNKLRLKNDIYLDNFSLNIKCDSTKCYKGHLDSQIGTKFVKMLLKTFEGREEWIITSSNAGALLKGLGMYEKMKSGTLLVIINTTRQEIKAGEPVPIVDGSFTLKRFVTTDTPFLTRIVSFISLPGLMSAITNNKNITFSEMTGKFDYKNGIVSIRDGAADGPFFDFTMKGNIDTVHRKVNLKGRVVPSLYGISTIIKHVPIIGTILSGGHRKGIVSAPFSVEQKY